MFLIDLLANGSLTSLLMDSAVQLITVSILGFIIVKLLGGKSAPVRSLAAAGVLASMLCLFILSVAFHASDVVWYKADISRFAPKPAVVPAIPVTAPPETATPALANMPSLPDITMKSAVPAKPAPAAVNARQTQTFKIKATHYINALGLVWAGGIIFMLLKLGYGLAFIRGFRFGLNRISDEKITRLLKITAAVFNKQRLPELYTSPKVESPITIGLLNPIVIVPEKLFATLSDNELKSILLHELAHIYHYDHVVGVFKRIAIAANWWNPLTYIISAKHAVAREEVADNYVLRELAPKVYSECLAGLAEKICLISSYPAAAGMAGNYSSLEQRVRSILSKKRQLTMTTGTAFKFTTAIVCGALALFAAGVQGGQEPELTPEKIIAKMAETYAKCKSYQDTGTVKTVFIQAGGNRTDEKPFSTAFVRPDQFRFEYKEKTDSYLKEKPGYIVWRKGTEVLTWFYAIPGIKKVESLSSGLAGATGVSGSSAHTIPALLLPEVGGRKLSDIKEPKLLEDGTFDNVNCFRVQGRFVILWDNGKVVRKPTVIWIDKNSFLVRRIDEENVFTFSNFRTEDTTTYYPVINGDIPVRMLEFDPPGGSEALNKVKLAEKAPSLSLDSPMGNSLSDEKEARRLSMIGYGLSARQAAELDQKLSKNPDDVNTITLLLSYWNSIYRGDNAARQKREKYILWMIEHHPDAVILDSPASRLDRESKETVKTAKKLWLEQAGKNPDNPQVLWNAANGVSDSDKALTEQFYIKGQALDPENPKWADRLGNIYFWGNQPEKAFNEYKKAYSSSKTTDKALAISRMTKSAVDCGKLQEAGEYALEMQQLAKTYGDKDENYGKLFFNSNLVLGRIALKQGRVDDAGKYLLDAGKTPISLSKGEGPDFALVKELLESGKKEIVLQFFQSCAQFWDKTKCEKWIKQINDGNIPSFKNEPKADPKAREVKKNDARPEAAPVTSAKPDKTSGGSKNAAVVSQMEKAKSRMLEDSKIYSKDELAKIDELSKAAYKKFGTKEGREILNELVTKYPKANKTGFAVFYYGYYYSQGDEQIKYLQQAITDFSDCYSEQGIQIGAYARYALANIYLKRGEKVKAVKLFEEIKTDYPDGLDFSWHSLVPAIAAALQTDKAKAMVQEVAKIYSQDDLAAIGKLYGIVVSKWNSEEGKASLKTLLSQYPKANSTGCALLYLGEKGKSDERIEYLRQVITDFSNCFDTDGIQLGPYARLLLARIYLKNGENAKAIKLLEDIRTSYPDAIDRRENLLVSIVDVEAGSKETMDMYSKTTFWDKLKFWYGLQDLQESTGFATDQEKARSDALIPELIKDVYLVKFKPVNGFDPATAGEFITNFSKYSSLYSNYGSLGGASMFVTANVNDHLVGSFLTKEPQQMKADIEKNPSLQFLSCEKVTPEMFVKYARLKQEDLMEKWKTKGPKIIEIIPANGAKDVNPGLTKIIVKFDRKMGNKSWAVCTVGRDTELPIDGKVYYDDSCTVFTIPLKPLQPDHSYATSLNAGRFIGFISADGTPLYPYPYTFTTKATTGADANPAEVKKDAAKQQTTKSPATDNDIVISLATTSAEKWLALVDDGKYPASWTTAAAYFKNAVTAAAFEQAMKTVRAPLGKLLSRKAKSAVYHTSLPGAPDGRYVVVQFETSFENKKEAIETVTPMADGDGQWRVSGYYIK